MSVATVMQPQQCRPVELPSNSDQDRLPQRAPPESTESCCGEPGARIGRLQLCSRRAQGPRYTTPWFPLEKSYRILEHCFEWTAGQIGTGYKRTGSQLVNWRDPGDCISLRLSFAFFRSNEGNRHFSFNY